MAIEGSFFHLEGTKNVIDNENLIASSTVLMNSGRTLQEEWDLLCQRILMFQEHLDKVKDFIGSRIYIPHQQNTLVYAKGVWQSPVWTGFNTQFMSKSGSEQGINAGKYDVTFVLNDPDYVWSDGSTDPIIVSWYIKRAQISYPVQQEPFPVFNGDIKELIWTNVTPLEIEITGGITADTEAGIHSVFAKPTPNYCWPDGSFAEKEFTWKIEKTKISVPVQTGDIFFNGHEQSPVWDDNGKDTLVKVVDGESTGTIAKTYEVWFKPTDNATWTDGTCDARKATWTILHRILEGKTTGPNGLTSNIEVTFNGTEQIPVFSNYDPILIEANDISIDDNGEIIESPIIAHRNVGSYITEFRPKSNVTWNDGTVVPITISWSIKPRAVKIPYISWYGFLNNIELSYTGENIGPDINDLEIPWVTADNVKGITTNIRTAKFSLKESENTVWEDNTTQPKTYTWKIVPKKIKIPTVLESLVTYNGGATVHPLIEQYDSRFVSVTGNSAVNVNNDYVITFSLVDPVNTCWEDGTLNYKFALWSVTATEVIVPTVTDLTFTYNNSWQGPNVNDYDMNLVTVTGREAKNAGTYTLTMTLSEKGTVWADTKDSVPKTVTWVINRKWIPVPVINVETKVYNNEIQYLTATGDNGEVPFEINTSTYLRDKYSSNYLIISGLSGKNASNNYTAVASLTDIDNTVWETGSDDVINFPWKILPKILAVPVATGNYTYTGETYVCSFDNFFEDYMTVTGHQASAAGQHTAVFDLKDKVNTSWPDGSVTPKKVTWNINAIQLDPASLSLKNTQFIYDGTVHKIVDTDIEGFSQLFILTGQTQSASTGTYTVKVCIADPDTYCWSDGRAATASVNFVWQIQKRVMQVPVIAGTNTAYTYTGETFTITKDKCVFGDIKDADFILLKNNTGSAAGAYNVTFSIDPSHIANCTWSDGSVQDKQVPWVINKDYLTTWGVSKTKVDITGEAGSYVDVTVSRLGDGKVNVITTSDYVTVETTDSTGSNPVLRFIDSNGPVQTVATVTVEEGTNYCSSNLSSMKTPGTCPATIDINVNVLTNRLPSDFTPARIKEIVQQGLASTVWKVGDIVPVSFNSFTLSGTGSDYIPAGTYDAVILGFDHNCSKENPAASHTMTVAVMHKHNVTDKTICFFDRSIVNPMDAYYGYYNENIFNAIDDSWKEVILTTRKYATNRYQDSKVFNLSSYEVYGNGGPGDTPASDWSDNKQKQYDYFKIADFPLAVYPQYLELGTQGAVVTSRSQGSNLYSNTVIAFLNQSGYYYSQERNAWVLYGYGDWCSTPLPHHTVNYSSNIQTGIIPCFNIG